MWWLGTDLSCCICLGQIIDTVGLDRIPEVFSFRFALAPELQGEVEMERDKNVSLSTHFCKDLSGHTFASTTHMRNLILGLRIRENT